MQHHPLRLLAACSLLVPAAHAQTYQLEVQPAQSNAALGVGFVLELPGSLIGDFDPVSNPTGTQTRPGLFGGSGNVPIDVELSLEGRTQLAGSPTGNFVLTADTAAGTVAFEDLALDLLGGNAGSADLTLNLLFDTFRTFDPTSLYIGGIPLPIPLGSAAVTELSFAQAGPGVGTLTPTASPDTFDVAALVTGELSFAVEFAGNPTPVGPVPFALPLGGTLTLNSMGATFSLSGNESLSQTLPDPLPGFEIEDIPLPLPTILPPGGVANVLLSFLVEELVFSASLDISLTATGQQDCSLESYCAAEPNSAGAGAQLSASGSSSIAANDLVLDVADLPTAEFGFFLMSQQREDLPAFMGGVGRACIAPPFVSFREQVQRTGLSGSASMALDLTNLPMAFSVAAGEQWNFQFWYRDQFAPGGRTTNTSSGLSVRFCP